MMTPPVKTIIVILIISSAVHFNAAVLLSLEKTYMKAIDAYKGERWTECIKQFEETLHLHKLYRTVLANCRLKCNSEQYTSEIKENIEDLKIYEKFFNTKNCLKSCKDLGFKDVNLDTYMSEYLIMNMQRRKPYEYLQMCYFQMYALPKAASATYTYLVANPEDEAMKGNLEYYKEQPEVEPKEIVDLMSEDYTILYKLGRSSYEKSNWGETIASMEEVITDYFSSENFCRVECETLPVQEWSPEFAITTATNMASLLHCRQQCQEKVRPLGYDSGVEFLADVLNYLQISYYHLDKLNEAAKAVASYLVLMPDDEVMLENKQIYSSLLPTDAFTERSDVVYFYKRDKHEKSLLDLFDKENKDNVIDANAYYLAQVKEVTE